MEIFQIALPTLWLPMVLGSVLTNISSYGLDGNRWDVLLSVLHYVWKSNPFQKQNHLHKTTIWQLIEASGCSHYHECENLWVRPFTLNNANHSKLASRHAWF